MILPFIFVYGIYVILHGAVSPNSSFASGIIVGLSFVAFAAIFGIEKGKAKLPEQVLVWTELRDAVVRVDGNGRSGARGPFFGE